MKFVKKIDDQDILTLEGASFLVNSAQDIIFNILTIPDININNDRFNEYVKEYTDKYGLFELLKMEISQKYLPNDSFIKDNIDWSIDFYSSTITVASVYDEQFKNAFVSKGFKVINEEDNKDE